MFFHNRRKLYQKPDSEYIPLHLLIVTPPVSLQKAIQNYKPAGDCAQKMASAEAQQGISPPTIVLIDEKYDPFTGLFALLQSLKFLSAEVP